MTFVELHTRLSSRIFGGLAATLSTSITGSQITSLAASSASAASAIIGSLPVSTAAPGAVAFDAEQCAVIFAGLANGLDTISGSQITSIAALAVSSLSAVQAAVNSAIGASSTYEAVTLQIGAAAKVFSGLAQGLSTITQNQTDTIAGLSATAASAIVAAL